MDRRTLLAGVAVSGLGIGLVGCAGTGDRQASSSGSAASGSGSGVESGALPVTIEHQFGSTTIKQAPERIVCVGLKEQDDLLALGIVPVGATKWLDFGVLGNWAKGKADQDGLDISDVTELSQDDGIQFEKIAGLKPDLILALYTGLKKADYDKLSQLAPVVAPPKGLVEYGIGWDEQATTVGKAVGRPQQMQKLVDEVKASFTKITEQHQEFSGRTGVVATLYEGIYLYGPQDPRSRLMSDLGFESPTELAKVTGEKSFGASVSMEKIELVDTDLLIWLVSPSNGDFKKLRANKLYSKLRVAKQGRAVTISGGSDLDNAFNFCTVLSIPAVLKKLTPKLVAAVDGNPKTTA